MYLIRRLQQGAFELSKFEDKNEPVSVYKITNNSCNCPAYSNNCRHKKMLSYWKEIGSPVGAIISENLTLLGRLNVTT